MGLITRVHKVLLLNYYEGSKCVCGQKKRKRHWSCRPCHDIIKDSEEAKKVTAACDAHTKASADYLDGIKKRIGAK